MEAINGGRKQRGRWDLKKPKIKEMDEEKAASLARDVPVGRRGSRGCQWGNSSRMWVLGRGGKQVQALKLETGYQSKVPGVLS